MDGKGPGAGGAQREWRSTKETREDWPRGASDDTASDWDGSITEEDVSGSEGEGEDEEVVSGERGWASARDRVGGAQTESAPESLSGTDTDSDSDSNDGSESKSGTCEDDEGTTQDLFYAVSAADFDRVRELLAAGTPPDRDRRSGDTPLYTACSLGYLDIVHELVHAGASLDRANSAGFAPLHVACMNGRTDVVNLLLSNGADADRETELCRRRPLHIAVRGGYRPIVSLLLRYGADVRKRDLEGNTLIHLACLTKQPEMLGSLVTETQLSDAELGRAVNLGKPITQWTALHVAAQVGLHPAVQILVGAGATVKVSSSTLQFPLHVAAQFGRVEIVRTLLQLSNQAIFAKDANHATPLFLCCKYRSSSECAALLVQYGSKTTTKCGDESPKSLFQDAGDDDPVGVSFREALIAGRRRKHLRAGATKKKFTTMSTQVIHAQRVIAQHVNEKVTRSQQDQEEQELTEAEVAQAPATPDGAQAQPKRVYEGFGREDVVDGPKKQACACNLM